MYGRSEVSAALNRLSAAQSGVISRAQALGLGLGRTAIRRLVGQGAWLTLEPGLYLVPALEPSWLSYVWGGILLGGPDARVGGATAASLQGLSAGQELPIDVLIPSGRRITDRSWVTFRQERDGVRAASTRSEPARTRVEDTVLDLCSSGSDSSAISVVTTAVQRRLTTAEALLVAMARRSRLSNRRMLTGLLSDVANGVHSALEHRYRHDVEKAHGLPPAVRQAGHPGRAEFVDVLYRAYGVLVELDGRFGHVGAGAWRDRRRDNAHARLSALTLRYGWYEVSEEPCAIAAEIFEVLISRGCGGYPLRCPRCV